MKYKEPTEINTLDLGTTFMSSSYPLSHRSRSVTQLILFLICIPISQVLAWPPLREWDPDFLQNMHVGNNTRD